ncbi:MAG TPA: DUF4249 domain-containing protein, partial [Puia sp.]|nr:DUF4249 domain-containing protein [Puia sp.]
KYRLHIKTSNGKSYTSDYVPVKQTPPIDSVTWEQNNDVNIFVNTHDPQNNTWYYHWDFVETWEYKSTLSGTFGLNGNNIYVKDSSTETDSCWQNSNSTTINVASSIALKSDVISHQPVTTVEQNSVKISVRYSILVQQYALTQEAYQYRLNLQNNTQSMGSIFDAQPSQLFSNIHSDSDPNEPVIGYVSASTVTTQRIFIDHSEVGDWNYPGIPFECKVIVAKQNPPSFLFFNYNDTTYYPYYFTNDFTNFYLNVAKRYCLDCRWWGGTTNRPSFW